MAAGAAGCGASAAKPAAASTTAPPKAPAPGGTGAAKCSAALTPWTQYIADTNDFGGWVSTVGAHSPLVQLPQDAARVYLGEVGKDGTTKASADGFSELDRACSRFAAGHPSFDYHAIPTAPTLPS